jgi:hypothetical protein
MNSRERLQAVLNHKQADRLCVDFGAGNITGIGAGAVYRLHQAVLGDDPNYRVKIREIFQMLGEVDEPLRAALKLDVVGVHPPTSNFGFRLDRGWKPTQMMDGTPILVPVDFQVTTAPDGGWQIYAQGDTRFPPRGFMPKGGYFFDVLFEQDPVDDDHLNPADNCEEFVPLPDGDVQIMAQAAADYAAHSPYGIYLTLPGGSFGDIARLPGPSLKEPKGIRGVEEWYITLLSRPAYVHAVFEKQLEVVLANIDHLAAAIGDHVDVAFVTGMDFGTQAGLFFSVDTYRTLFKPYHVAVNRRIHEKTHWKTFIHTDGAVRDLMPDFIEAGFEVFNPIQWTCPGMDAKELKREFGKQLVFWGGGVDAQHTLAMGKPDEVYHEARRMIDIFFGDGTGYVFNGMHNVQSNVPTQNMLAMFRAADDARKS